MASSYVVKAPAIVVANPEQGGRQEYYYSGAPVPSFVTDEVLTDLEKSGLIEKQEAAASGSSEPKAMADGDDPADFSVKAVAEHYAAASDEEKARIIAAESGEGGKNRTGVLGLAEG